MVGKNEPQDPIERNLQLLVRLKVKEITEGKNITESVLLLSAVGFTPSEIADLLGTTTNTVSPILSRARRKNKK